MKLFNFILCLIISLVVAGCATSEQLAKNLENKHVAGDGLVIKTKIGLDTVNQTPEVDMLFINGSFQSIPAGKNYLKYTNTKYSAWYNKDNQTQIRNLVITANDNSEFQEVLKYTIQLIDLENKGSIK